MPIRLGRRPHWIVVTASLAVLLTATAVAVHAEPPANSAAAAKPGASGTAGATGMTGASGSASAAPSASGSPTTAASGPHMLSFGIAYGGGLFDESDTQLATSLNDAVAVGAKWARTDLPWDLVQPSGPSQFKWASVDRVVNAAKARGLKLLPIIDAPPTWARSSACKTQEACPPASATAYANFAAAAAARYAPLGVHAWEIWNEPNLGARWLPKPDPAAYQKLLAAASTAVRHADKHAFIVLGGLAAVNTVPSLNYLSAFDFLTAVAQLGGLKSVNAVGFHPYTMPVLASVGENFTTISSARDNLVAVLQNYGEPDMPIWLTESGAQVNEPNPPSDPIQLQAAYATDLVQTVSQNAHVGADFWFSDGDFPKANLAYGLRDPSGNPRPVFNALKTAIASCGCNSKQ